MAQLQELERATCDVLQNVKEIHELRNAKLSVIGGLAVWHYLPEYRSTDNINFITNLQTSPSSLKKRLLEKPNSPFFRRSQALFYLAPSGQEIRVDISPQWLGPYLPETATRVEDLARDEIPYISLTDLIVFKLDSSGLRSNPLKKDRDARDAAALVDHASRNGPIELTAKQEQVVEEALCDVGKCGTKEKSWWEEQMGLNKDKESSDATPTAEKKQKKRPHSKSDPTPSPLSSDPNTAWLYEEMDHLHRHASSSSSRAHGHGHGHGPHGSRNGVQRSSSQRLLSGIGYIMTHPKTTLSNLVRQNSNASDSSTQSGSGPESRSKKKPGRKQHYEVDAPADPTYPDEDEDNLQYYTLEPRKTAPPAPQSYFDVPMSRGSSAATPSNVTTPRRPPLPEHTSVSFVI
ncbi:hypothetical protein GGR53DRAFT_466853 [Hypoxylon sp. FL1150]|nr:hypothetical protein GGR53DRAFT_466853 [Hypoxylon sp. FL1150]